ncbi:phosphatidylserine decarboxylase [Neisseria shayeganii]|uniref:Phosphatidylserine decarboxylase proenzyme n=1 Tax=Neisseria shayeganii TaxID=607712 RepID=A0A7D7RV98_9NEIS|nr:phosphatidylserine decarboxylase [Neisseria shayeganii]QMT40664.1 phosphatidylserine decarboxylase [Neisseria shayeganii]
MNRFYPHPVIALEGWPFIIGGLIVSLLLSFCCGWWSLPFWLFTLFAVQFFRDPARDIPQDPDAVLCPADGRIVVVERATDPFRQTEALKISVFMNVFNVHSQRAPVDGTVTRVEYFRGKFLNAALDKASTENERNAVLATTRSGRDITFVQVAGLVARRVLCYVNAGEPIVRGERYGFIRFGSRVDVYLPVDAQAAVSIGDKVKASETILARLPLTAPAAETPAAPASAPAATAEAMPAEATAAQTDEQQIVLAAAERAQAAAKTVMKQE